MVRGLAKEILIDCSEEMKKLSSIPIARGEVLKKKNLDKPKLSLKNLSNYFKQAYLFK